MSNPSPIHISPWRLTPLEAQAMDKAINHGSYKGAARALDVTVSALTCRVKSAQRKIGARGRLSSFIAWDRWRRSVHVELVK